METWRPATESAASLFHWEKTIQGAYVCQHLVYCYCLLKSCGTDNTISCGPTVLTGFHIATLPLFIPPPVSAFRTLLEQVDHWQSFLALVNMIMFCTGIPGHYPVNETTSSLTLTFWYTLQVRHEKSDPAFYCNFMVIW